MAINAEYLGMPLGINDLDIENTEFFRHCSEGTFHLQACDECSLLRYPPTTACPWCACLESRWTPVDGKGTVHSYGEVHQAIQHFEQLFDIGKMESGGGLVQQVKGLPRVLASQLPMAQLCKQGAPNPF